MRTLIIVYIWYSLTSFRAQRDLDKLSALGHFLKGSSATLGLTKVKDSCEKIQHYGARKDETGTIPQLDDAMSLRSISTTLKAVKEEYREVKKILKGYYHDSSA